MCKSFVNSDFHLVAVHKKTNSVNNTEGHCRRLTWYGWKQSITNSMTPTKIGHWSKFELTEDNPMDKLCKSWGLCKIWQARKNQMKYYILGLLIPRDNEWASVALDTGQRNEQVRSQNLIVDGPTHYRWIMAAPTTCPGMTVDGYRQVWYTTHPSITVKYSGFKKEG